ncbi:MAG: enoyl-CoA hydratase/isomerase family protein [Paralcaligenes sp.]
MSTLILEQPQPELLHIKLNRPEKRNALSAALVEELIEAFDRAEHSATQAVVFTGNGKNFSAGFDLENYQAQSEGDLLLRLVRIETLLQKIAGSRLMTIALAHGRNFGAGVDLLAACKLRVASPEASFRMPGIKFGLILGTNRLARLVGHDQARALLEKTCIISAEYGLKINLISAIAEPSNWDAYIKQEHAELPTVAPAYRGLLYQTLAPDTSHTDMSLLARSAAEPGIKQRIATYLNS